MRLDEKRWAKRMAAHALGRWFQFCAVVVAFSLASVAVASGFIIPPGKEAIVAAWITEQTMAKAGGTAWQVAGLAVVRDHVAIRLVRGKETATFRLIHPTHPDAARAILHRPGLALVPPVTLPNDSTELVQALTGSLQAVDGRSIWQVLDDAPAKPPTVAAPVIVSPHDLQLRVTHWLGWGYLLGLLASVGLMAIARHIPTWMRLHGQQFLLTTSAVYMALELIRLPPPVMLSTASTNLPVWDCLYRVCEWQGEGSSFHQLRHGALLLRIATAIESLGLSVDAVQRVITTGMSLSAGLIAVVTGQMLAGHRPVVRQLGAATAATVLVVHTMDVHMFPTLWAPEPLSLPLMLHALTLVFVAQNRSTYVAALTGICLGAAVDAHVAATLLVPPTVLLLAAGARRSAMALVLAAAGCVSWLCVSSPASTALNAWLAQNHGFLGPAALVVAVCGAVGVLLRPRFAALLDADRRMVALFFPGGLAIVAILLGGIALQVREPLWKYTEIAVPSVAAFAALFGVPRLVSLWHAGGVRRAIAAFAMVLTTLVGSFVGSNYYQRVSHTYPTVVDAERLARSFWDYGYDFATVFSSVTGPAANLLASFVGGFAPPPGPSPSREQPASLSVAVVAVESAHLFDATWHRVSPSAGAQLAWRTFPRYTAIDAATTCSPQSLEHCIHRKLFAHPAELQPGTASQVSSRWTVTEFQPRFPNPNRLTVTDPFAIVHLTHTLALTTGPDVHLIAGLTGWKVAEIKDVPYSPTHVPGLFRVGGKKATGSIRFETTLDLARLTPSGLPDFAEVREDEENLLVAMQQIQADVSPRSVGDQ